MFPLVLLPLLGLPGLSHAQTERRAAVVVKTAEGEVLTACVTFDEPQITGLDLLERAGFPLSVESSAGNAAVCSIANQGCQFPTESCFCQCKGGGPCRYWAYWHLRDGAWQFAQGGAATYQVQPGEVDGWGWGDGNVAAGSAPPVMTFDQVCRIPDAETTTSTVLPSALPDDEPTMSATEVSATALPSMTIPTTEPDPIPATPASATPTPPTTPPPATGAGGQYILFGGTLLALIAAIGFIVWRRR